MINKKRFTFLRSKKADSVLKSVLQKAKPSTGFTLIEVLVTVAVTGILTIMATVIFINTVRNSKKAEITAEARQNAALVIDRIQKDTRDASSIATSIPGGQITQRLTINPGGGDEIQWDCVAPPSANGYISRHEGGVTLTVTNRDPVDGISISDCEFTASTSLGGIKFTAHEGQSVATGPQEYDVNLEFQTSITTRGN